MHISLVTIMVPVSIGNACNPAASVQFLGVYRHAHGPRAGVPRSVTAAVLAASFHLPPFTVHLPQVDPFPFPRGCTTMATKIQTEVVTKTQSLQILKHTLNLGVSSILYLRNCFEEDAFQALRFQGLDLRQLKPVNPKARRILGWLQSAVNDALQKVLPCRFDIQPILQICYCSGVP